MWQDSWIGSRAARNPMNRPVTGFSFGASALRWRRIVVRKNSDLKIREAKAQHGFRALFGRSFQVIGQLTRDPQLPSFINTRSR
jgi:hypothetical protein